MQRELIGRWRDDPGATYRSWFLWPDRLKNFRSIRRGLQQVVGEIEAATFGNLYRGSSLETVVRCVAEQRQIFKGADHAFLWKPKLRIPDIYEDRDNQRAFGAFLAASLDANDPGDVLDAIRRLAARQIKGVGPAAANLVYFLHPTAIPPFNTAIVKGYNALTGANVKLGNWGDYLAMRDGILRLNAAHRDLLSNDLGAIAGLLFDLGSGRYAAPPREGDADALRIWEADLLRVRDEAKNVRRDDDVTHAAVQSWLRDLGRALGFDVWIAANDQSRMHDGRPLGEGCCACLPDAVCCSPGADAIRLIDVLWVDRDAQRIAAAFEVEHSTSIYSGIVRLLDLAFGAADGIARGLYLVAPDDREEEVRAQVRRPAFQHIAALQMKYLPYSELQQHRDAIARFGRGLHPIESIARPLV